MSICIFDWPTSMSISKSMSLSTSISIYLYLSVTCHSICTTWDLHGITHPIHPSKNSIPPAFLGSKDGTRRAAFRACNEVVPLLLVLVPTSCLKFLDPQAWGFPWHPSARDGWRAATSWWWTPGPSNGAGCWSCSWCWTMPTATGDRKAPRHGHGGWGPSWPPTESTPCSTAMPWCWGGRGPCHWPSGRKRCVARRARVGRNVPRVGRGRTFAGRSFLLWCLGMQQNRGGCVVLTPPKLQEHMKSKWRQPEGFGTLRSLSFTEVGLRLCVGEHGECSPRRRQESPGGLLVELAGVHSHDHAGCRCCLDQTPGTDVGHRYI